MNGGLLVDKPAGITSHDVVAAVRRALSIKSVGHTGTLDPFATGLLVLVLGRATRLARFIGAGRKEYDATAALGVDTTTDDATGQPIGPAHGAPWPDRTAVENALSRLVGRQAQRPPAYSAKRVDGVRSYTRARSGAPVELAAVDVEIESLTLTAYEPPAVGFRAVVGPGTYIRAIARDVGRALGTGGHLRSLRRTRVGPFRVEDAIPLPAIRKDTTVLSPRELLVGLPEVALGPDDVRRVGHGRPVGDDVPEGELAALVGDGEVLAVARGREGAWQPVVVLSADA